MHDTADLGLYFCHLALAELVDINSQLGHICIEIFHDQVTGGLALVDVGGNHASGSIEGLVHGGDEHFHLLQRHGIILVAEHGLELVGAGEELLVMGPGFIEHADILGGRGIGGELLHLQGVVHHPLGKQGVRQALFTEILGIVFDFAERPERDHDGADH